MPRCCSRATRARAAPSRCTSPASRPARSPPCASSSARTGSARSRIRTCSGVYDARTLEGRAVAVAQAPPGRRLDELLADGPLGAAPAVRIARQVASAVDALEEAGAEPPPLTAERIWVDGAGDAHLDGLDARIGLATLPPAASSSAALARLVADMTARVPRRLETVARPAPATARTCPRASSPRTCARSRPTPRGAAASSRSLAVALLAASSLVALRCSSC